jgi:hypothetical protein
MPAEICLHPLGVPEKEEKKINTGNSGATKYWYTTQLHDWRHACSLMVGISNVL